MSLNAQLIALLRVAKEPLTVHQLRGQLMAVGVANDEQARRRLRALRNQGVVEKIGDGSGATYRLIPGPALDECQRRQAARAGQLPPAGVKRPAPKPAVTKGESVRDSIVDLITKSPGLSAAQIKTAMTDAGIAVGKNEPHATLYKLVEQGRLRPEGEKPFRRYYAVEGAVAPTSGPKAPAAARQAAAEAATVRVTKPASDDPLDLLDDAIAQHLELCEPWITRDRIAHDIDENPLDVARSLKRLVDAKRASVRTVDGTREYAFGTVTWAPEATPTSTAAAAEKPSEPDAGETIPIRPAAVDAQADGLPAAAANPCEPPQSATEATGAASIPRTEGSAVTAGRDRHLSDPANPREEVIYTPAASTAPEDAPILRRLRDLDAYRSAQATADRLSSALRAMPRFDCDALDLTDAVRDQHDDLDDLIGRACDERVDHAAIKALVTASAALRRASRHLQSISTTPAANPPQ